MSVPFEKINGEKIDLSRQDHRDEIIKRNKDLDNAVKNGMFSGVNLTVSIVCQIECLKCGSLIEGKSSNIDLNSDLYEEVPIVRCGYCKTKYVYNITEELFFPRTESKKKLIKKVKNGNIKNHS